MKDYATTALRNVALLGHGSSGKTSLGEAMLFSSGAISRQGRVEDGSTVSDFDDEEIRRHISLTTSLLPIEYQGHKLNILYTQGFTDFAGERRPTYPLLGDRDLYKRIQQVVRVRNGGRPP